MRILVVAACPLPWPRGTPIRIHRMAEALLQRGHEIHMATYPLGHADTPTPYQTHRVGWKNMRLRSDPGPSLKKLFVLDPLLTRRIRRLLGRLLTLGSLLSCGPADDDVPRLIAPLAEEGCPSSSGS